MKISPTSWHYRLYVFMCQWNAAWRDKDDYWEYPKNTTMLGLCHYMRMILIWGPLAILSNLVPIATLLGAFFIFPAGANGIVAILWLFGAIAALAASIFGISLLKDYLDARDESKKKSQLEAQFDNQKEKPKSFLVLMYVWIHDSICPMLELPQNDD